MKKYNYQYIKGSLPKIMAPRKSFLLINRTLPTGITIAWLSILTSSGAIAVASLSDKKRLETMKRTISFSAAKTPDFLIIVDLDLP